MALQPVSLGKYLPSIAQTVFRIYQQRCFYSIIKMSQQPNWEEEKNRILSLSLEEKRKLYKSNDYIALNQVDPWSIYAVKNSDIQSKQHTVEDLNEFKKFKIDSSQNKELSEKVSIFKGDITKLEVN